MADDSESEDDWVIRPYGDSDFSAVEALWQACGLIVAHNEAARGFYQAIGYACEPRIVMSRLLPR